jgi:hypothetical protein
MGESRYYLGYNLEIAAGHSGSANANVRVTINGILNHVAQPVIINAGADEFRQISGYREYCFAPALQTINVDVQNTAGGGSNLVRVRRCRIVLYKTSA